MSDTPRGPEGRPASPFAREASSKDGGNIYRPAASASSAARGQGAPRFNAPNNAPAAAAVRPAGGGVAVSPGVERPVGSEATPASRPAGPEARPAGAEGAGAAAGGAAARTTQRSVVPGVSSAASANRAPRSAASPAQRTRKARLRLSRIDPWSVMKTSFLFSIAFGILMVVASWVLWAVLQSSGTFESINRAVNDLLATPNSTSTFDLGRYVTGDRVIGFTALIAAADVVIFTALATLFSFLYNLSATVLGGLEVTLAED